MSRNARSTIPHSWCLTDWPVGVYPHQPSRARYLVRAHKQELLAQGALCRVGRELVVLGDRYSRWLERQSSRVADFECAANLRLGAARDTAAPPDKVVADDQPGVSEKSISEVHQ